MTTAHSPLRKLRAQADKIAMQIKALERGEVNAPDPLGKVAAARAGKKALTFAVVMDDKVLKIEMPWATIVSMSEAGISEWILKQMRESRETTH